jgi:hypothetical protein
MWAGTKQVYEMQTIQAGPSRLQFVLTHTECKVIVLYTLDGSDSCEFKVGDVLNLYCAMLALPCSVLPNSCTGYAT